MKDKGITFNNVWKKFSPNNCTENIALKNITLTIEQGDFVSIVGMNGSGKSTLARMMNGLILPSTGEVVINGMNTMNRKNIKKIRSLVGMVFQNPDNQIISPVVEEDIAFGPVNLRLPYREVKERIDWVLEVLNLEQFRYHSPHLLSGGQKQKVAIASALAMKPSYLILDEPTSMLDNESRSALIDVLKYLNKEFGITIVLISHLMEDVSEANRLIVLNKGEIYLDDTPWKLFVNPEKLKAIGISPPKIVYLLNKLRERGHKIDEKIVTLNQAEEFICQLLKQKT
ncbi:energy-coupling factor transporter ATPase [Clostridium magnum]|uniref:Energy-coupling factor transporter ATP-binding protein EcfA2 n=1 Tax=Clostridium magnum DSM 2767 TaxID=1121326 RepID=A0A161YNJ1_9CLOT|nr:energy-coupling factor transporter ATPase [Clostridium magnum]KZL92282.1 energy-coupling factor transporter ATP-binding protein EcfA2 [Clostridium magnum DSM 2767]SHH14977.1 energy-coupling factor transport system ATP-binding protein [Clostridium magnum DSM 2767]